MSKLHHTAYKKNYKEYILECLKTEDVFIGKQPTEEELINYLFDRFEKETPDLGKTMWAGYNALTHWSTHTDETIEVLNEKNQMVKIRSGKSTADKPSVQRTRNDEVRTVIECDSWKTLEVA